MGDRGIGKPWTPHEDSLLTQAVAIHGEVDNWKTIALSVPGRTNKACRKRWLHSLSPSVKKTAWTPEEDQLLLSLYAIHSTKWSVIARHIPGRTDDACSKRYREALDPSLKRDEWTAQEDALLLEVYARLGGKWGQVGQELQRSGLACRNRWRMIERKKAALIREDASRNAVPSTSQQQFCETYPSHVTTQWPSVSVQPGAFWDGNVPPYVVSSPSMGQFRSSPSFVSSQPSSSADPPPFQFASSSLSAALASPESSHDTGPQTPYSTKFSPADPPNVTARSLLDGEQTPDNAYEEQDMAAMDVMIDFDFQEEAPSAEDSPSSPVLAVQNGEYSDSGESEISVSPRTAERASSPASPAEDESGPTDAVADSPTVDPVTSDPLRHYRPPERKTAKPPSSRKARDSSTRPPPRLSANLPAAGDSTILAYACGHKQCWPSDADSSRSCFATSKELLEHTKADHSDDTGPGGPFRCALQGCGKSWKSINGLQYHLQISKVHFQQAFFASRSAGDAPNDTQGSAEDSSKNTKNKKVHPCPYPNCLKQYKQLSGLRYHIAHGHPAELPAQLEVIPPALARKVAERTQNKAT